MALPDDMLSSAVHQAGWLWPMRAPYQLTDDYERAGIALYDGTLGMDVKTWHARVGQDANVVQLSDGVGGYTTLFTWTLPVVELALAFDRNMHPFLAFTDSAGANVIWWYDSTVQQQVTTVLSVDIRHMRASLDDKRLSEALVSDIVLAYQRGANLCVRYQLERFAIEHVLTDQAPGVLVRCGMNVLQRFQFQLR